MEPEAPRDLRALLARAGGRQPLLLAGEARPAELETFARDLLAEAPPPPPPPEQESPEAPGWQQQQLRRARVRGGGDGLPPWRDCALLLALFRAASLEPPRWERERRRLREILRDLRAQLPAAPPPAVVGVVLLLPPAESEAAEAESEEAARLQLEALLRRVFREGRRRPPPAGLPDTLQAVTYRPGEAQAAREAACRALRAALKLRADGAESPRRKLPATFSWCLPWGRRNEDLHTGAKLNEDALQDLEGAIALTNIAANGKCEEGWALNSPQFCCLSDGFHVLLILSFRK